MCVELSLLYRAGLHVHLLVVNLFHLVPICLFYEGLDCIKLASAACGDAHATSSHILTLLGGRRADEDARLRYLFDS